MCIFFNELPDEQQNTVRAIFADPPPDILWLNVLILFDVLHSESHVSNGFLCVALNLHQEMRRGIFPYSGQQGCISRHTVNELRNYLRGVGVEPN
ncbi:hypothetical protein HJG54_15945 [Leptolyngbya sp. NK1-12]|uniref:Uncharacterized protein n=1 Tax=Leptolyngbya sp. NK1-12 TaxID=2547451 RepID=A0AA97AQU8_9CYAN|nr:hypothetical protein [Leptolyngbya sp. NK1-12]MBF2045961.1 hypothetical protein [Elainella sp. C42_A2020_010]WNZ24198.1 hypothetical protein HJG54_15945 [Leptolyngbya sp. NK1-12]